MDSGYVHSKLVKQKILKELVAAIRISKKAYESAMRGKKGGNTLEHSNITAKDLPVFFGTQLK